jgi:hypothetical protein
MFSFGSALTNREMQLAIQPLARTVATVDPSSDPRYDSFVSAHERAGAYHAGAWARILGSAYGFRPCYLALEGDDGALEGAMPLIYSRGLVSGRRLRGLPVVPPAGPLGTTREAEVALVEAACRMADRRARVMTFQSRTAGYEQEVEGLSGREKYPAWVTPLGDDPDALRLSWKKRSNNLFRSIAKAEKTGVTVREGTTEADLGAFYGLYLETMKRHRSLPRGWRQQLLDMRLLGPSGVFRLFLAEHEGNVVAAGVFHAFGDTVDLLYNGSSTSERDLRANFALYWHALRWSIENGYSRFDWGQAQEGGNLSRFKAQWSAEPEPEYVYEYVPDAGAATASRADRIRHSHDALDTPGERSRKEQLVDGAWERVPLRLTQAAGALVYRLF